MEIAANRAVPIAQRMEGDIGCGIAYARGLLTRRLMGGRSELGGDAFWALPALERRAAADDRHK